MTVNKAIIVGRLGADPEVRSTETGTTVANMRIATSREYKGDEETEWHRVTVFGNQADACGKYLSKGRQVYVEGRIQTNEWQDRDGNNRYTTEIVAQTVQFLSGGGSGGREGPPPPQEPPAGHDDESFDDDDIPF